MSAFDLNDEHGGASELSEILIARWELAAVAVSDPHTRDVTRFCVRALVADPALVELLDRMCAHRPPEHLESP